MVCKRLTPLVNSPKVITSLGRRWASGCLGMAPSCSSTSENNAVINSTVLMRLSFQGQAVTQTSVEESSDDCKPKNLHLLVCTVLYKLIGANFWVCSRQRTPPRWSV